MGPVYIICAGNGVQWEWVILSESNLSAKALNERFHNFRIEAITIHKGMGRGKVVKEDIRIKRLKTRHIPEFIDKCCTSGLTVFSRSVKPSSLGLIMTPPPRSLFLQTIYLCYFPYITRTSLLSTNRDSKVFRFYPRPIFHKNKDGIPSGTPSSRIWRRIRKNQ